MTSISRPGPAWTIPRLGQILALGVTRSRTAEATAARLGLLGVSFLAAILYLVNLTVSGYANTYYSAAAWAASQSWSAWFFGSIDPANFITVDKPPLATMLMGLSVRLLGLSSASILLPQALAGVATVMLVFAVVRRSFGTAAATIAGVVTALTPAAVLIFRYNNPDALLTLLLVGAALAMVRGLESDRRRWLVLAGILVGLAFNTKYLQAYLVLPAFAITWIVAGNGSLRRRIVGLLIAAVTVLVASGWWVAVIELLPAAARPFIGGSTNNSALDLVFGYDGLGRIFGLGGGAGGGGGANFGGTPGFLRLFNAEFAGQVSWFLPFSLIALVAGLVLRMRAGRRDPARAGYLLWGLWLAVHVLVFSFMSGTIHSYYVVALAPAIGALVGAGVVELWKLRSRLRFGGLPLAGAIVVSAAWAWALLDRTPLFAPGLGFGVLAVGLAAALVVALPAGLTLPAVADRVRLPIVAATLGLGVLLAGPAAYAFDTIASAHSGGDPSAGPASLGDRVGGFGGPGGQVPGGLPGGGLSASATVGVPSLGGAASQASLAAGGPPAGGDSTADAALVSYLLRERGTATWIVAVRSANQAGALELATGQSVMAMGGFTGSDPAPTLAQFKELVAEGKVRFVLVTGNGGGAGGPGGSSGSTTAEVESWAASVGTVVDYGGNAGTLYDVSGAVTNAA